MNPSPGPTLFNGKTLFQALSIYDEARGSRIDCLRAVLFACTPDPGPVRECPECEGNGKTYQPIGKAGTHVKLKPCLVCKGSGKVCIVAAPPERTA